MSIPFLRHVHDFDFTILKDFNNCPYLELVHVVVDLIYVEVWMVKNPHYRPLSQVGSRRKRCPCQFGKDGMGSIPATPSTKHTSCFPPSSMPASIEISIKLIVCLKNPHCIGWSSSKFSEDWAPALYL
jgi:hypothetical protein